MSKNFVINTIHPQERVYSERKMRSELTDDVDNEKVTLTSDQHHQIINEEFNPDSHFYYNGMKKCWILLLNSLLDLFNVPKRDQ